MGITYVINLVLNSRHAIEVNRKDYRAWYGLGQTYELLKMSHYCLYYYRQAQYLRPNDSRMCVALGTAYEKLDRLQVKHKKNLKNLQRPVRIGISAYLNIKTLMMIAVALYEISVCQISVSHTGLDNINKVK